MSAGLPYKLILTANRLLARYLAEKYGRLQKKSGQKAWGSPQIFCLTDWLKKQWLNHPDDHRYVLSSHQEISLWERIIIEQTGGSYPFLRTRMLARASQKAWRVLNQWGVECAAFKTYACHDLALLFMRCAAQFEKLCEEKGWVSESQLLTLILNNFPHFIKSIPHEIEFAGFNEIPPLLSRFSNQLKQHKKSLLFSKHQQTSEKKQIAFKDSINEIKVVVDWTASVLKQAPESHIGIVVNRLDAVQKDIVGLFKQSGLAFDLSLGKALSAYPIVRAALIALDFNRTHVHIHTLSEYLYAPFFESGQSLMVKHLTLLSELKQQGVEQIPIRFLKGKINTLETFLELKPSGKHFPSQWGAVFKKQLLALGWPGERPLDSEEYQTVHAFWDLLMLLDDLDGIVGNIGLSEALSQLNHLAFERLFKPKASVSANVHIIGLHEASGIKFDYLWVMGMDADNWPAKPSPSALIPIPLQRKLRMPHASAACEFKFSQAVTACLANSAPFVTWSYSATLSERAPTPSGLIKAFPYDVSRASYYYPLETHPLSQDNLSCLELLEEVAPKVNSKEQIRGGTYILKAQSACSFQAFAKFRLHVEEQQSGYVGLKPIERGVMLHRVLEQFWSVTKTQDKLLALSEEDLSRTIEEVIHRVFKKMMREKPLLLRTEFLSVEKKRLKKQILAWLNLEKKRTPFVVDALEKSFSFELKGLILRATIDRIDRLPNGAYILIDYKTSRTRTSAWEDERIEEPQLPFYFVMVKMPVHALAFGQIHPERIQFNGVALEEGLLPGVKGVQSLFKSQPDLTWTDLKHQWKKATWQLIDDFCEGKVAIEPKALPQTCEHCKLQMLCRVHEFKQMAD